MADSFQILMRTRLLAIVQAPAREDLIARALAAAKGGIQLLALPISVPFVAEIAAEVADAADVIVGLSEVVAPDHLNVALAAGAQFVITPVFDDELVSTGRARGLDVLPSVYTPNELHGASRIHVGPLAINPAPSPEYVAWLHALYPELELVAMGGIGSDSAPQYLEQGASAVVVDKGLFPEDTDPHSAAIISVRAGALVELCAHVVMGDQKSVG
jgi:2-dehydro-3-deoxyphosphogluconate aldolase/(4S)-4-hydroxy-2-oxoglutarate aldolase